MNSQTELKVAHQRLDNLKALSNKDLLERAWNELSALCGSNKGPPKEWTMTIPVDADRDSDVLFGEVLMRFVKLEAVAEAGNILRHADVLIGENLKRLFNALADLENGNDDSN